MSTITENLIREIKNQKQETFSKEEIIKLLGDITAVKIQPSIESNGVFIDTEKRIVTYENEKHNFPRKEFELLYYLVSNKNKCVVRDNILRDVWGDDVFVVDRTIDVHIRKLRSKLKFGFIKTEKGVGYKWIEN
jgi:DNA-binding response OmpR family regulator